MKILDEKGLSGIVRWLLELILIGGIAILISLPYLIKWYIGLLYWGTSELYWFLLPFLYVTGVFAVVIVFEMKRVFMRLSKRNPFMEENIKSLKHISVSSFIIAAVYVIKIIFFNSFLTIILCMAFVIAGLFMLVLAEVFRQAMLVKEENDLTI